MPKLKTKSSVAKRVKVTKSGKLKIGRSNRRHLLLSKRPSRKRRLRKSAYLKSADEARIRIMLPYA